LQETRSISGVRLFNGQDAIVDALEVWVGDHPKHSHNQVRPSVIAIMLYTACLRCSPYEHILLSLLELSA